MNLLNDLAHNVTDIPGWAGATIASNTDTDGIIIDTQGYTSTMYSVYAGAITDGSYALKIFQGDNSGLSDGAEVPAYQVQETHSKSPDTSNTVKTVGAKITKRYCRLRITSSGTTSGGVFKGAVALLGGALDLPVGLAKL